MNEIAPQPGIMEIALYQGGASSLSGVANVLKLSANENPFGPPKAAKEAVARAVHDLHRYPTTDHRPLREAIAGVWGLDAERIICGVGSDEVIYMLCQAYAGPGDEVIHTEHGFALHRLSALAAGATPVEAPERERVIDVDAVLERCSFRTKLVFVTNPANPTGTMLGQGEIARLADGLPKGAILVIDGAYAEFVPGYEGGAAIIEARENVVMTRTFSKIYGLGGMRVGWGYGPRAIIDVLNRIRGPFNLSGPALAAAEAAVLDPDWLARCQAENAKWRDWLAHALGEVGVPSDTSSANFILARFADAAEAEACNEALKAAGIIVRPVGSYGLPQGLRITIGDEAACRRVAHVIGQFKAGG